MTKYCPTCQQAVPDQPPLPVRIRAALAASDRPLRPKDLRAITGVGEAVMYQTLRRMAERGDIRKSTVPGPGGLMVSGYVLSEDKTYIPEPVAPVSDLHRAVGMVLGTLQDVGGSLHRSEVEAIITGAGHSPEQVPSIIGALVQVGSIREDGEHIRAVEP